MKTAMILAAGRGERLKPITALLPKALCAVRGKPLIEHHIINLASAGFERIVINHAYLGGQIRRYLGNGHSFGVELCYSPEPPGGLETGGGIMKALPLLGRDPFVTVNGDVYTDFDFTSLPTLHNSLIPSILVNKNSALKHHGDFGLSSDGLVSNEHKKYTFAGIACYQPAVFEAYQQGRYSVTPIIRKLVSQGQVSANLHQGIWFDIGSLERLNAANQI